MNRFFQKTLSLLLVILIIILVLENFNLINYSDIVRQSLYFATLIFVIISCSSVICSKSNAFKKFINYSILIGFSIGVMLFISENKLNISIYVSICLAFVYALSDLFTK